MDDRKDPEIEDIKDKIIKIFAAVGLLAVIFGVGVGIFKAAPGISGAAGEAAIFLSSQFFPGGPAAPGRESEEKTETREVIQKISGGLGSVGAPSSAQVGAPAPATPSFVDLAARILETGIIDPGSGQFVATSSVRLGNRAAVQFEIINFGNVASDGWTFNAVLPTLPNHIFGSDSQSALKPRDRAVYTLGFDSIRDVGKQEIVINADPTNSIKESNETNNISKATITVSQ